MARISNLVGIVLLLIFPASLAIKFSKYGRCVHATPCGSAPTDGLVDDWALLVATSPSRDKTLSFWGPTFAGCDTNSIQESCSNQGIFYSSASENVTTGFVYGYNVQLQKWTIENFQTLKFTVGPTTDLIGYRTVYYSYISIDTNLIFKNGQCQALSGAEIVYNPMLRKVNWVLLDTDQNKSYRIIMNCENVDGFLYDGYPQIQIYVKRSEISKYNKVGDMQSLTCYGAVNEALKKQKIDPTEVHWRFIPQDLPCPTKVLYDSMNFDNCQCKITGTGLSIVSEDKGYY